jgi:hypothetical protein
VTNGLFCLTNLSSLIFPPIWISFLQAFLDKSLLELMNDCSCFSDYSRLCFFSISKHNLLKVHGVKVLCRVDITDEGVEAGVSQLV